MILSPDRVEYQRFMKIMFWIGWRCLWYELGITLPLSLAVAFVGLTFVLPTELHIALLFFLGILILSQVIAALIGFFLSLRFFRQAIGRTFASSALGSFTLVLHPGNDPRKESLRAWSSLYWPTRLVFTLAVIALAWILQPLDIRLKADTMGPPILYLSIIPFVAHRFMLNRLQRRFWFSIADSKDLPSPKTRNPLLLALMVVSWIAAILGFAVAVSVDPRSQAWDIAALGKHANPITSLAEYTNQASALQQEANAALGHASTLLDKHKVGQTWTPSEQRELSQYILTFEENLRRIREVKAPAEIQSLYQIFVDAFEKVDEGLNEFLRDVTKSSQFSQSTFEKAIALIMGGGALMSKYNQQLDSFVEHQYPELKVQAGSGATSDDQKITEYFQEIQTIDGTTPPAVNDMIDLLRANVEPSSWNQEKRTQLNNDVSTISNDYEKAKSISPPPSFQDIHALWLSGLEKYARGAALLQNWPDVSDGTDDPNLVKGGELITEGNTVMDEARQRLSKILGK